MSGRRWSSDHQNESFSWREATPGFSETSKTDNQDNQHYCSARQLANRQGSSWSIISNPAQLQLGDNGQVSCAEGTHSGDETSMRSHCRHHLSEIFPEDVAVRPNK